MSELAKRLAHEKLEKRGAPGFGTIPDSLPGPTRAHNMEMPEPANTVQDGMVDIQTRMAILSDQIESLHSDFVTRTIPGAKGANTVNGIARQMNINNI